MTENDMTVLDVEVKPPSLEKWLIDYGKDRKDGLSDEIAQQAVDAGYLFDVEDRNFTDAGLDLLEANGVVTKVFFTITLGRSISPIDREGKKWNLMPGSVVLVVQSSLKPDRKTGTLWDDILVSDAFPVARLFRSKLDTRAEHRWPAMWPLGGKAKVVNQPLTPG